MKVSYTTKHHCIVYKAESNLNKKEIVYSDKKNLQKDWDHNE